MRKPLVPLPLDELPVLVIDEFEALREQADAGDDRAHDAWEWGRANHVHEQAIACLISFVDRLMQERVVEYEKLVLAPIAGFVANDDIGGVVVHIVEIVQNPQRRAQEAKMLRGRNLLVKNR